MRHEKGAKFLSENLGKRGYPSPFRLPKQNTIDLWLINNFFSQFLMLGSPR